MSAEEFRAWKHKSITLLGMSGVGKTRLSHILRRQQWFHYSGDYRIGTHYLDEPILDNIKSKAMQVPFLKELLRTDAIYIRNNITVDNLTPVSTFLGKLGDPELGGLSLREFKYRQALHHQAEVAAMRDVPRFIGKSRELYGYRHFVNDAGGSLCELEDQKTIELLDRHTMILYIKATKNDEQVLIERAAQDPKPLYYRPSFLEQHLAAYMEANALPYVALVNPDAFARWVFPKLFYSRIPRYDQIARDYGYTLSTDEASAVRSESDFLALMEDVLRRSQ